MKIKIKHKDYEEILALPRKKHQKPKKQSFFFRLLLKIVSAGELRKTKFTCRRIGMEKLGKKEPCLFLMNHSSFIDLKIASTILFPRRYNIVTTADAFVGKKWLMRQLGCMQTTKFVGDVMLLRDMQYALKKLKSSVLMYPEAGYSFDGTSTVLPDSVGGCLKLLGVPVVMIRTYGAFTHDPLYNGLQQRKVKVSAEMKYLLSPADIAEKSAEELSAIIREQFSFDSFRWQRENRVAVREPFRADGMHRVLYKCPHCAAEGQMEGKGIYLTCHACGKAYELTEYGALHATRGETAFSHIPDWYAWQRDCVRRELEAGTYGMDTPVTVMALVTDAARLFHMGEGRLLHNEKGFHLTGCDGKLDYKHKPQSSYSLNADFFWYEIGDVISIGNQKLQYYCFPQGKDAIVAKARLATEELYKMLKQAAHQPPAATEVP